MALDILSPAIEKYIKENSTPEDVVLQELTRETHLKIQMPQMLSGHLQGLFLEFVSRMVQPRRILEIGTFTGYSAICLAKGLTDDGLLYTIDINDELEPINTKYFEKAGISNKVKRISGDAKKLVADIDETFDIVFIDADKQNYAAYFDLVIDKVRKGGYIIADNVLWSGKVVEENKNKDTQAIHDYNQQVVKDPRVINYILPLRDGLNIAQKIA